MLAEGPIQKARTEQDLAQGIGVITVAEQVVLVGQNAIVVPRPGLEPCETGLARVVSPGVQLADKRRAPT
jgi:hypothetical protein